MKVHFTEVFNVNSNGISPRIPVKIGGISMGPGVTFGGGVSFGNVNLGQHINHYLEVEKMLDGVIEIKGIYN